MDTQRPQNSNHSVFYTSFSSLEDPRRTSKGNLIYPLNEIIFLTISAAISGASAWTAIESFGKMKLDWLRGFFPFENGIPSHDTISDVFCLLAPASFEGCFINWVNSVCSLTDGEVVAVDGKTVRGAASGKKYPLHIVSAYAEKNKITLGQVSTDEKSNEITAIPKLLEILSLKGAIVTIDAMGCQKEIAKTIIKKEADYVLMVKDNQKELKEQVEKVFHMGIDMQCDSNIDAGHGRIETRKCTSTENLDFLDGKENWCSMRSVAKIESERICKKTGKISTETRFYISSLPSDPKQIGSAIRKHWAIENNLHWNLDVIFKEDGQLKRKGNSPYNFNIINKIALALLEKETSVKNSKNNKRLMAALNDDYRRKVLNC